MLRAFGRSHREAGTYRNRSEHSEQYARTGGSRRCCPDADPSADCLVGVQEALQKLHRRYAREQIGWFSPHGMVAIGPKRSLPVNRATSPLGVHGSDNPCRLG